MGFIAQEGEVFRVPRRGSGRFPGILGAVTWFDMILWRRLEQPLVTPSATTGTDSRYGPGVAQQQQVPVGRSPSQAPWLVPR